MSKMTKKYTVSFDVTTVVDKEVFIKELTRMSKKARELMGEGFQPEGNQKASVHLLGLVEAGDFESAIEFVIKRSYRDGLSSMMNEFMASNDVVQTDKFSPVSVKFREA